MKTHLIIDTFFNVGDVIFIGTKKECEQKLTETSLLYSGLEIKEMSQEDKEYYNS